MKLRLHNGPPRQRKTRRSVRLAEMVSRWFITVGGIGTIIAVATVFLFLLYVVIPLFQPVAVSDEGRTPLDWSKNLPVHMGTDEDQMMAWALFADGSLQVIRLDTGELLQKRKLFDGPRLTAVALSPGGSDVPAIFGFADGSMRTGKIHFTTRFLPPEEQPESLGGLEPGQAARFKDTMGVRLSEDRFRLSELEVDLKDPVRGQQKSSIRLVDQSQITAGQVVAILSGDKKLRLNTIREQTNKFTGESTFKVSGIDLPYAEPVGKGPPQYLFLSAVGDQVLLFWTDGHLMRFDARDRANPQVAEERDLLDNASLQVSDVRTLIGKSTYLVGDTAGRVRAWFFTHSAQAKTTDGGMMVCAHDFAGTGAAVTRLTVSDRSRMAAAAYADGAVRLLFITSDRIMAELSTGSDGPAKVLALAPKDDGLLANSGRAMWRWKFDPRHPEVSRKALFGKVWYEGYEKPQYMWQSSGGTDSFEPKYSLIPLIFGTLKATFYSLLFGVPLALLAAVYTSEFLHPRTKAVIKPTIEMMASLPSVVLGFLAGLVFAQFMEAVVPAVLACLLSMPLAFMGGAYLWQLLPEPISLRLSRFRFLWICLVLPAGLAGAMLLGPVLEKVLFAGDLRTWLNEGDLKWNERQASGMGGWVFLLLPLGAVATAVAMGRLVNPWLRQKTRDWGRSRVALTDVAKFLVCGVLTLFLAWLAAGALQIMGLDPRDSFFGPYSQRNALVVGFVVGFAVIPIIYTISEDALSSVPEHLRAGSLAAGATRWQTATRIIIPTAMSGLFSAVMIGMGRAVGETMIMLMATGNTPVMEWNVFNGFRTLSANIAVELPESVVSSTHYRILFLAALVLFAFTFVLNTLGEMVRLRFRRRAYQL
jgi:phosphate transport system permease protein